MKLKKILGNLIWIIAVLTSGYGLALVGAHYASMVEPSGIFAGIAGGSIFGGFVLLIFSVLGFPERRPIK